MFSGINFDNLPSTIHEFFPPDELAEMSEYEKIRLSNLRQNFEALRRAGLPVKPPDFMLKNKSEKEKQLLIDPPFEDSAEDSDGEWTPALERTRNPPPIASRQKFIPPRRVPDHGRSRKTDRCSKRGKQVKKRCQGKSGSCKNVQPRPEVESAEEEEEIHVYSLRKRRMCKYMCLEIPDDDSFLYCEDCDMEFDGDCPVHGPLLVLEDTPVPGTSATEKDPNFSVKTLPAGLTVKESNIPGAGLGIFATRDFPKRTRFGPYGGKRVKNEESAHQSGYCWQIFTDGKPSHFVDAKDPCTSNWMRYINCARSEEEQSVTAYQYKGEIYYRAHKDIASGAEILVYYGDSYAQELGIQTQRVGDLSRNKSAAALPEAEKDIYSCDHCWIAFSADIFLERHMKRMHSDEYWALKRRRGEIPVYNNSSTARRPRDSLSAGWCRRETIRRCFTPSDSSMGGQTSDLYQTPVLHSLTAQHEANVSDMPHMQKTCLKQFVKSDVRKKHQQIHTGEKPYRCETCHRQTQLSHLKRHQQIHTGEKPYRCETCHRQFTQLGHLKKHQQIHTGEKPYRCETCHRQFTQLSDLKKHQRIHTGEKPYRCETCHRQFTELGHLKSHQQIHTGEKPYRCETCHRQFTQLSHLKSHQRIHTGEKPYRCETCHRQFTQLTHLKSHQRIHTGEKPYRCETCHRQFTELGSMKRHQRIHTGEKPYRCETCHRQFTQLGSMKRHQRIHTGEKLDVH